MTIMVDGVKLNERRINKIGEKVRGRMKGSLSYLTKMMKGLYSGDMNNDNDFRALQDKIVSDLIETNSKTICKDVQMIVKEEMISVAHQCGSQAMKEARVIGKGEKAPEWGYEDEVLHINLDKISDGKIEIGEHIVHIDSEKLNIDIQERLLDAENKKVGIYKKKPSRKANIIPIPEGASLKRKNKVKEENRRSQKILAAQKKTQRKGIQAYPIYADPIGEIDMTEELKNDPNTTTMISNTIIIPSKNKKKKKIATKKKVTKRGKKNGTKK